MRSLQVAFVGTILLIAYLCGIWRGRSQPPPAEVPRAAPRDSPPVTSLDPLERHRAYLDCRETKKICVDSSAWTPEETDVYVRQMVSRVGGMKVGAGP